MSHKKEIGKKVCDVGLDEIDTSRSVSLNKALSRGELNQSPVQKLLCESRQGERELAREVS